MIQVFLPDQWVALYTNLFQEHTQQYTTTEEDGEVKIADVITSEDK